jgi:cytidylate kinase
MTHRDPLANMSGMHGATRDAVSPTLTTNRPKIVAVDGPAGSGKSSICYKVAGRIGWTYINTGAIYRAVGLIAARAGVNLDDETAVALMVDEVQDELRWQAKDRTLWYGEQDVTPLLGSEEAGHAASKVARQSLVRAKLLPLQKRLTLSAPVGALVDGRDIGTVVFPDADLKIFLTASLEERSRRRLAQLGRQAEATTQSELEDVMRAVASRDERDEARSAAPLKQAPDAVMVDTSRMTVDETIETIVALLQQRGLIP